jgi:hypothetical protein
VDHFKKKKKKNLGGQLRLPKEEDPSIKWQRSTSSFTIQRKYAQMYLKYIYIRFLDIMTREPWAITCMRTSQADHYHTYRKEWCISCLFKKIKYRILNIIILIGWINQKDRKLSLGKITISWVLMPMMTSWQSSLVAHFLLLCAKHGGDVLWEALNKRTSRKSTKMGDREWSVRNKYSIYYLFWKNQIKTVSYNLRAR